jgi:CubicO group peptidase (beta-lactamase class C family)
MTFMLSIATHAIGDVYTTSSMQEEIDDIVRDELIKAKIPNAAVAIINGDETEYLPYTNKGSEPALDMNSLFQIGSLSKAYTGLGILLLEDEKLISLDDPVNKYLPWFTVSYDGKTVRHEAFTIANLLYQTSGFTKDESQYPAASNGISVEHSVRQINGSELAFYPSQQFAYANTNYRILGLIIEAVSGQSYDEFMTEHILLPLGLESTYTNPQKAKNTGKVVEGSRLSFLRVWTYDAPVAEGNVPAGYIYSNISDMSRWLHIQMGKIEVSEQFQRIIEKSHRPNTGSIVDDDTYYAAGWFINNETGEIYHSGGTPNYSTNVTIHPQSNIAVCVLTNMYASVNTNNIAANILNILEDKPVLAYQADIWMIFDLIFSFITIFGIVGTTLFILVALRLKQQICKGQRKKTELTRKSLLSFILPSVLTILTIVVAVIIPIIFRSSWMDIGLWVPLSLLSGMVSLIVLSVCAFGVSLISVIYKKLSKIL